MRRSYLKEGCVQLTALDSLLTHSRYLFLFSDLLLVAKQKATNSYKLKEKVRLDRLWIASNDCPHSFLIGWPISNFIAHFTTEEEKIKWHEMLKERIERSRAKTVPKSTTLPLLVRISGRSQIMKKRIGIAQSSGEILVELINELAVPNDEELELVFDPGNGDTGTVLQGPETIYCVVMDFVRSTGYRLSEQQLERLDIFPLIQCRLILSSLSLLRSNPAHSLVSQFKRVLRRSESRRFFGRNLEGSAPPQPVLTMIDHLLMHSIDVEGIFRKSPKQTTLRLLKAHLDRGSVPDFNQFSPHVTAALLKEYLRAIPGKLLLTGNLELWISAMDRPEDERRDMMRRLLQMLPSSHIVLLSALLRLMRAISNSVHSKMSAQSLAVCIAPSLLDSPKMECAATRLPKLAEYLILNAPRLIDNFQDAQLAISSSASNDSGLSDVETSMETSASPELHVGDTSSSSTPASSLQSYSACSPSLHKHYTLRTPPSTYYVSSFSTDEDELSTEIERDDDDRTPVLSRENSDAQKTTSAIIEWKMANKDRFLDDEENTRWLDGASLKRRETVGTCRSVGNKETAEDSKGVHRELSAKERRPLGMAVSLKCGSPSTTRKESLKVLEGSPLISRKSSVLSTTPSETNIHSPTPRCKESSSHSPKIIRRESFKKLYDLSGPSRTKHCGQRSHHAKEASSSRSARERSSFSEKISNECFVRDSVVQENQPSCHSPVFRESLSPLSRHPPLVRESPSRFSYNDQHEKAILRRAEVPVTATVSLPYSCQYRSAGQKNSAATTANDVASPPKNERIIGFSKPTFESSRYQSAAMDSESSGDSRLKESYRRLSPLGSERCKDEDESNGTEKVDSIHAGYIGNKFYAERLQQRRTPVWHSLVIQQQLSSSEREQSTPALTSSSFSSHHGMKRSPKSPQHSNNFCLQQPKSDYESANDEQQPCSRMLMNCSSNSAAISQPNREPVNHHHPCQALQQPTTVGISRSTTNLRNEGLRPERESVRKERKKNRSILMDPLEVNWSVDELRSIFQQQSGPPRLNTDYRSNAIN